MKRRKKTTKLKHTSLNIRIVTALSLMLLSNLGWILPIVMVPFLKTAMEAKVYLAGGLIIFGHVSYNFGLFLLGAEFIRHLRENPLKLALFWIQFRVFKRNVLYLLKKR